MIKELEKAIMVLNSVANQHYHLMPITAQEAIEELTVLKQQNLHPQPCTPLSDEEILATSGSTHNTRNYRMKITLEHITPNAEELISRYSAVCYDSDTTDPLKNEKRIKHLMRVKHLSTLRHAIATFRVEGISRACSHQFVRSKHLDFLQRSQRYCSEEDFDYVNPVTHAGLMRDVFDEMMIDAQYRYSTLIESGMKKEDARMVLPNAATTELIVTASLQGWVDFVNLRCQKAAQQEIRTVATNILAILHNECPNIFQSQALKYGVINDKSVKP